MKENIPLAKKLGVAAWIITALVLILTGLMRRVKIDTEIDFSLLPPIHASFNVVVAIALLFALFYIKRKNIIAHRNSIFVAMIFSFLFLLSYVAYHFTTEETKFCMEGSQRTIYFLLLISHIVLAGISLPFILFTFIRGYTYQVEKHKKLARWVWPVWFYVAVSGPICYLMLMPCYS
jgi:putative membrane protein